MRTHWLAVTLLLLITSSTLLPLASSGKSSGVNFCGIIWKNGKHQLLLEYVSDGTESTTISGWKISFADESYTIPDTTLPPSPSEGSSENRVEIPLPDNFYDSRKYLTIVDDKGEKNFGIDSYCPFEWRGINEESPPQTLEDVIAAGILIEAPFGRDAEGQAILPVFVDMSGPIGVVVALAVEDADGNKAAGYPVIISKSGTPEAETVTTNYGGYVFTLLREPGEYTIEVPVAELTTDSNGNPVYEVKKTSGYKREGQASSDSAYKITAVLPDTGSVNMINAETETVGNGFKSFSLDMKEMDLAQWAVSVPIAAATATAPFSGPYISEVQINPTGSDAGNEWVEITNPTGKAVNLNGYTLTNKKGTQYKISEDLTVAPGASVLVKNPAEWLDDASERIILKDSSGAVVDGTTTFGPQYEDSFTPTRFWNRAEGVEEWVNEWSTPEAGSGTIISTQVVDESGTPVEGMSFTGFCQGSEAGVALGATDANGNIGLYFQKEGCQTMRGTKEGYLPVVLDNELKNGDMLEKAAVAKKTTDSTQIVYADSPIQGYTSFGPFYALAPSETGNLSTLYELMVKNTESLTASAAASTTTTTTTTTQTTTETTTSQTTTGTTTTPSTPATGTTSQPEASSSSVPGFGYESVAVALALVVAVLLTRRNAR